MKSLLLLLLPVVLGTDICNVNYRILGGEDADQDDFPGLVYILMLYLDGSEEITVNCAGSLIGERWVLTAAHCLAATSMKFQYVRVFPTKGHPTYIWSTNVFVHEEYIYDERRNDIALILLPVSMSVINPHFRTTPLPLQDQPLTNNEVTLVGWGVTSDVVENAYPQHLQKVEHVRIDQGLCQWAGFSEMTSLCRYPTLDAGHTCSGDSGGPIFMDGLQVAIVSGTQRDLSGTMILQIDPRVSAYIKWIENIINEV